MKNTKAKTDLSRPGKDPKDTARQNEKQGKLTGTLTHQAKIKRNYHMTKVIRTAQGFLQGSIVPT